MVPFARSTRSIDHSRTAPLLSLSLLLEKRKRTPEFTMANYVLDDISHRRYNTLRGTHVLVSPHRTKRPWQWVISCSELTQGNDADAMSY